MRLLTCGFIATIAGAGMISMATAVGSAELDDLCPDIDVVFARGSGEPAGLGVTGQAFVDSVLYRLAGRDINVYAVVYPAVRYFPDSATGIGDVVNHVNYMSGVCPQSRIVIGGFSRGAEIVGLATSESLPSEFSGLGPLPANVSDHIAAIVMMGRPTGNFLTGISAPPVTLNPMYSDRTIDLCAVHDPVCTPFGDESVHRSYPHNGMTEQAADFVAARLETAPPIPPLKPQSGAEGQVSSWARLHVLKVRAALRNMSLRIKTTWAIS